VLPVVVTELSTELQVMHFSYLFTFQSICYDIFQSKTVPVLLRIEELTCGV